MYDVYSVYDSPPNFLFEQENFKRYRHGGYHPVQLGDSYKNGRYSIHHKLGYGGFSTVWLAQDNTDQRWVSIKFMDASSSPTEGQAELHSLQSLGAHSAAHPGAKHIVRLLDHFLHEGPNGSHQCLVTELLGPSVYTVLQRYAERNQKLNPKTILKLSKQLLQAVDFMHSTGLAHGDLSPNNVNFASEKLSYLPEEKLFQVLGYPYTETLKRIDGQKLDEGVPEELVEVADWCNWAQENKEDLRIIDLGESFHHASPPAKLSEPPDLVVPESIFRGGLDHRVDLYRAGLTIYMFIFANTPFCSLGYSDVLASQMIGFVEELPPEWQPQWEQMRQNSQFENLRDNKQLSKFRLQVRFDELQKPLLKPLLSVMKGLVRLRPSDRISASQALHRLQGQCQPQGNKGKGRTMSPGKGREGETASQGERRTALPGNSVVKGQPASQGKGGTTSAGKRVVKGETASPGESRTALPGKRMVKGETASQGDGGTASAGKRVAKGQTASPRKSGQSQSGGREKAK